MLITFVKPINVRGFRTDNSSWDTRMDAAYGRFDPEGEEGDTIIGLVLYEGVQNQRDGTHSRFGLSLMSEEITDILKNINRREERKVLLSNWDATPPEDKYVPLTVRVRADNIRGYTS